MLGTLELALQMVVIQPVVQGHEPGSSRSVSALTAELPPWSLLGIIFN